MLKYWPHTIELRKVAQEGIMSASHEAAIAVLTGAYEEIDHRQTR